MTEIEDKPTLLRLPLNLDSTFAHKPDQIELQLDQFQPLYSEHLGLVLQEAAQPNITKRPAIGDNMTIEVTKENPHMKDHQNVLEARNLDGVFSKQEDQSQKWPVMIVVLMGVPYVAFGGKGKVIIQLGIALTERQIC